VARRSQLEFTVEIFKIRQGPNVVYVYVLTVKLQTAIVVFEIFGDFLEGHTRQMFSCVALWTPTSFHSVPSRPSQPFGHWVLESPSFLFIADLSRIVLLPFTTVSRISFSPFFVVDPLPFLCVFRYVLACSILICTSGSLPLESSHCSLKLGTPSHRRCRSHHFHNVRRETAPQDTLSIYTDRLGYC